MDQQQQKQQATTTDFNMAMAMAMASATSPAAAASLGHPHYPALAGFLKDPSSQPWSASRNGWNAANHDICRWEGVTCEAVPGREYPPVVGINIPCTPGAGELHSTLPAELSQIDTLRELMAYDCDLVGTIPTELAGLPHLQKLLLGYNALTRAIPQHFASNDLTGIWLEHNDLRGPMPSLFGTKDELGHRRSALMTLSLTFNHPTGSIPDDLSELGSLEVMEISHNEMSGALPSWLKELDFVELTHNRFNGTVPLGVCDVVGHNLDHYVLDGNAGLEGCGDGVMAMAGMYMSRLDWLWPFILGALVLVFLVARLALFARHRCGKCRCQCTLPRWECSCPKLTLPACPAITCSKMPKMPSMSLPRIICPRIYLPSLPLFSRKKAKVLDESMSDFHMTQEWGTARRRWWQRKTANTSSTSSPKNSEVAKKIKQQQQQQQHQQPPPPRSSPVKHGESVRPKMSRRNSWSALADRVESRRMTPTAASSPAKNQNTKPAGDDDGEEEVWFVPIPKKFDEKSAVIDDGAEEIMDISVVKGEGGTSRAADKSGKKRKKKKKKKSQRVDDGTKKNGRDETDDYGRGDGGWQETSRLQLM